MYADDTNMTFTQDILHIWLLHKNLISPLTEFRLKE